MNTRPKKKQNGKGDKRVTIDAKHNEQVKTFKSMKREIPVLESKINNLSKEIDKIEDGLKDIKKTSNDYIKFANQKMRYEDEIQEIEQRIAFINDDKKEYDYYLSAGPYVMQYFVNKSNISKGEIIASKTPGKQKKKPYDKSILDFIMEQTKDNIATEDENIKNPEIKGISFAESTKKTQTKKNKKEDNNSFEHKLNSMPLDKINDKYMNLIDNNYISKDLIEEGDLDYCYDCQLEMKLHQNDGRMVCPGCGITQKILVESDKQSCKDPPKEVVCMGYKRINHFRECVAQIQAKETTDIPEDLYDQIIFELKKERFHNMAELTPEKLRDILKKIKKNKYYEHIPHIINQLNGLPPPTYSKDLQVMLDRMFTEIQIPFQKYRPKNRKNFLSYSYVLYKFFELLEMKDHCKNFNLLKSREKLYAQDLIWRKITKVLGWKFIKSI
jgi:prefoldin subunit 5